MKIIESNEKKQMKKKITEINVPHLDRIITFELPLKGPFDTLESIISETKDKNKIAPTASQLISFIYTMSQNFKQQNRNYLKRIIENSHNHIYTCTKNLSFPEGTLIYENITEGHISKERLIELSKKGYSNIRYIKNGFKTGPMSIKEATNNPFLISLISKKIVPKFQRIAEEINKLEVYIIGPENIEREEKNNTTIQYHNGTLVINGEHLEDGKPYYFPNISKIQ